MLADDHLDIGDRPVGGPHPHAGFETVTLLLEGAIYDRDEGGVIQKGEVQWMTAGRGIIHGENVAARGKVPCFSCADLAHGPAVTTPFQDITQTRFPFAVNRASRSVFTAARLASIVRPTQPCAGHWQDRVQAGASFDQTCRCRSSLSMVSGAARVGKNAELLKTGQGGSIVEGKAWSGAHRGVDEGVRQSTRVSRRACRRVAGPSLGESETTSRGSTAKYRAGQFSAGSSRAPHTWSKALSSSCSPSPFTSVPPNGSRPRSADGSRCQRDLQRLC
jgi:hypothetical protein